MMRTRPELIGSFGMVASTHWLASAAGMSVLEQGGNAVDAAVASGFVMQIVEPHLSGPAGDLSAIVWSADDDGASVICGQGVAPAAASIEHFDSLGLDLVPGSGLLPATVPGAFGGWTIMLERWGSWELAEVLAYALYYAESGFPVLPTTTATIGAVTELFSEHWQPSAEVWLDGGAAPRTGTFWHLPATARTYRRLLEEAVGGSREQRIAASRRAFYQGFVADAVDRFNHSAWRDTSGRDHAGLLTGDDMARWEPGIETPVGVDFAGRYQVLKTGPWGQGPVFLQQLRLFEAAGLLEHEPRSANWIHHHRVGQTRLRRPGGLVRRSFGSRRTASRLAVRRVRGAARQADRRTVESGVAPGLTGRSAACASHAAGSVRRRVRRRHQR